MTRHEIITAVLNGGYIEVVGGVYSVYDPCGRYTGRCVWATAERVQKEPTVKRIEDDGVVIITPATSRRADKIENRETCKRYADDLTAYADGTVYRCSECGNIEYIPDGAPVYRCQHCKTAATIEDWEQLGLDDYLVDCYDIEYRIGGDKEYRSAEICIAWGGPNIYIDTARDAIKLFWGGQRDTYYISGELSDQIDDICEEQYSNI